MNYRHGYHAGNFADVLKHGLLVALLDALKRKPSPVCYVETHAGAGRYDLTGVEAGKTREFVEGITRLLVSTSLPAALSPYLDFVRELNPDIEPDRLVDYPGSPLIAAALLRPDDRLVLCELQEGEAARLKLTFAGDARVAVHRRDGYAALNALLPPTPRRGLVLIDPPFEAQDGEFRQIEAALDAAMRRWATGVYAIWYPIKRHQHVTPFHRWLKHSGLRRVLIAELMLHPGESPLRLNGCGLAIVNTPFGFDATAREILQALARVLATDPLASQRVEWLVED
jgi:23S rRNA (adenine2030-N6)-methyltransferase